MRRSMPRLFAAWHSAVLLIVAALAAPLSSASPTEEALWQALQQGGHVLLIRHTSTVPGIGDPPGFVLNECGTQRNLSEAGRMEAQQIGSTIRDRRVPIGAVLSSRWCRCLDTASLAFDRVTPWAPLDSHFDQPANSSAQTTAVKMGLSNHELPGKNVVLVTHQVNITALTGVYPAQGEVVVAKRDGSDLRVLGRLNPGQRRTGSR